VGRQRVWKPRFLGTFDFLRSFPLRNIRFFCFLACALGPRILSPPPTSFPDSYPPSPVGSFREGRHNVPHLVFPFPPSPPPSPPLGRLFSAVFWMFLFFPPADLFFFPFLAHGEPSLAPPPPQPPHTTPPGFGHPLSVCSRLFSIPSFFWAPPQTHKKEVPPPIRPVSPPGPTYFW